MAHKSHSISITPSTNLASIAMVTPPPSATTSNAKSPSNTSTSKSETTPVQVAIRVRPLTEQDRSQPRFSQCTDSDILRVANGKVTVVPHQKSFSFDHVFDTTSTQEQVFDGVASNLVDRFIDGYNVTILAYGQTSSGKTYTMGTALDNSGVQSDNSQEGIIPRAVAALFERLHAQQGVKHPNKRNTMFSSTTTFPPPGLRGPKRASSYARLRPVSMVAPHMRSGSPNTTSAPDSGSTSANNNNSSPHSTRTSVHVSFVEIYNEELIDLLSPATASQRQPITIREDTKGHIYWTGVKEMPVSHTEDIMRYLQTGTENRATGSTDMNAKSSRSHAIFTVTLKQEKWVPPASTSDSKSRQADPSPPTPVSSRSTVQGPIVRRASALSVRAMVGQMERNAAGQSDNEGDWVVSVSKFHFVDLAGSERLKRTAAKGDRRKEGININAGLLALGNVISALSDPSRKSTHVPYRDSKLTRLLQDSLGGNATTLMIACVSPAEVNMTETANTIQYAFRARNIKNKTERNEVEQWMATDNIEYLRSVIVKLKSEIRALKRTTLTTVDDGGSCLASSTTSIPFASSENARRQGTPSPTSTDDLSPSSSLSESDQRRASTYASSSARTTLTVPDMAECDGQEHLVSDLQRQIEELQNELVVTRQRNDLVEKQLLKQARSGKSQGLSPRPKNGQASLDTLARTDFQHLVEPIIEEYEKSISSLESQLAMARAALVHSDKALAEQETKMSRYERLHYDESRTLTELEAKLIRLNEREQTSEHYVSELEQKLFKSEADAEHSQQVVSELWQKIHKLTESGSMSEQYIGDLEERLQVSERAQATLAALSEQAEVKLTEQARKLENIRRRLSLAEGDETQKLLLDALDQSEAKCRELEQELANKNDQPSRPNSVIEAVNQNTLQVQLSHSADQMKALEDQLAEVESIRAELVEVRNHQESDIQRLSKLLDVCKRDYALCQQELTAQRAHNKELHKEREQLTSQLDDQKAVTEQQQGDLVAAESKIKSLQQHLRDQEESSQMTLTMRLEELEKVKLEMQTLQQVEEKQGMIIFNLESKMALLQSSAESLRGELKLRDDEICRLDAENKSKTECLLTCQEELAQVRRNVRNMREEAVQLEMVAKVLEGTMTSQEHKTIKTIETLEDISRLWLMRDQDHDAKCRQVEHLEAEQAELGEFLQKGEETTRLLEEELSQTKKTLEEQCLLVKQLETERCNDTTALQKMTDLDKKAYELNEALQNSHVERKQLERDLAEKDSEIAKAKSETESQLAKMEGLRQSIASERALISANDTTGVFATMETELRLAHKARKVAENSLQERNNQLQLIHRETGELHDKVEMLEMLLANTRQELEEKRSSADLRPSSTHSLSGRSVDEAPATPVSNNDEKLSKRQSGSGRSSFDSQTQSCGNSSKSVDSRDHLLEQKDATIARLEKMIRMIQTLSKTESVHSLAIKVSQLKDEKDQLTGQVHQLESQLAVQRGQLTLETKHLELEVMKLTAANGRLEKGMEHTIPRSTSGNSINQRSPPPTPRISSPSMSMLYKLSRDTSTPSIGRLHKSGSYRSIADDDTASSGRSSVSRRPASMSYRSDRTRPTSLLLSTLHSMQPPTAPPSNPLPPLPNSNHPGRPISSNSTSLLPVTSPLISPIRSSFSTLQRKSSSSTNISESTYNDLTTEQYEKLVQSLEQKLHMTESDVRSHQEVISKLESQLSRVEVTMRESKKRIDTASREKYACREEIETLRQKLAETEANHISALSDRQRLDESLQNERRLKEKAEKARIILENRMEELMSKKNKFRCF